MASNFVTLSWGKCAIFVSKLDTNGDPTTWAKLPTPANETTALNYNEGTEYRAEIEGGELEGYKRGRGNYELVFRIRLAPERTLPITDEDGSINDKYAIIVIPEDPTAIGISIPCATGYVATPFSSTEGLSKEYHFAPLVPGDGSAKVVFGVQTDPTNP